MSNIKQNIVDPSVTLYIPHCRNSKCDRANKETLACDKFNGMVFP